MSSIASTTHDADIMCCGVQADWYNHPARPIGGASHVYSCSSLNSAPSAARSEPAVDSSTTQAAAEERAPSQTASPIISVSEEKAENRVRPMSAAQALTPTTRRSSAALKYQR